MKNLAVALLALAAILSSCSRNPESRAVGKAYERLVGALKTGDAAALGELAPFLAKEGDAAALRARDALQTLVGGGAGYRVRMLDESDAVVSPEGAKGAFVPFKKLSGGGWVVSDRITLPRHIDFVPAR